MSCECKNINSIREIGNAVDARFLNSKFSKKTKIKIIYRFIEFYFYFVFSSVFNFIKYDKLEPSIPKWLIKKYNNING